MMPDVTPLTQNPPPRTSGLNFKHSVLVPNLAGSLKSWGATHLVEGIYNQNVLPPQPLDAGSSSVPSPIPGPKTHHGPKGLGTGGPGFCSDPHSTGPNI